MKKTNNSKVATKLLYLFLLTGWIIFIGIGKVISAHASGILFTKEIIDAGRVSKNGDTYSCTALCSFYYTPDAFSLKKLEYQTEEELFDKLDQVEYHGKKYALYRGCDLYRMKSIGRNIELEYVPYDDSTGKTSVTINYIMKGGLRLISSKTIDGLDIGSSYEYIPEESFCYDGIEYVQSPKSSNNSVKLDYLWTWKENNVIDLYYERADGTEAGKIIGSGQECKTVCINSKTNELICSMTQDISPIIPSRYIYTDRIE